MLHFAAGWESLATATRFPSLPLPTISSDSSSKRQSFGHHPKVSDPNLITRFKFSVFLGRKGLFAVLVLVSGRRKSKNEVESGISERR